MKKKILLFLFIIISFIVIPNITLAADTFGVVRYDVTNLEIKNDTKITFKGWAFINGTHNFRTYKGDGASTIKHYDESKMDVSQGDQIIAIRAVNNEGTQLGETIFIEGKESIKIDKNDYNYNFYCPQYYFLSEGTECIKAYHGTFPIIKNNNNKVFGGNNCGPANEQQCLYQDMGFDVTFDISNWEFNDNTIVKFQIAVHNNDYQYKINNGYNNGNKESVYTSQILSGKTDAGNEFTNKKFTVWKTISINKAVKDIKDSPNIIIVKDTSGNKVEVITPEGIFRNVNNGYVMEHCTKGNSPSGECNELSTENDTCIGGFSKCKPYSWSVAKQNAFYYISSYSNSPFKNGYKASSPNSRKVFGNNVTTYSPGEYVVYVKKIFELSIVRQRGEYKEYSSVRYPAAPNESDKKQMVVYASWVEPSGEFAIQVYNDKKCKQSKPSIKAACNSTSPSFSSSCEELTVNVKDNNGEIKSKANVRISQTGTITTVLTPTNTYTGGGFKFGIMYYNTISWSLNDQYKGTIEDITKEMQAKLKENFVDGFGLKNVKFGNEQIPDDYFKQNIKCQETGSFTNGNTLTTMCIVYLPNSVVEEYTGKVTYKQGDNLGLNNKYYTPIDWDSNKKYEVVATISGMDRLKESSVKADSKDKNKVWTGTWEYTLNGSKDNCEINLYPLYGQPTGGKKNLKYIFIYRPIDLNNPFPNRNPGMNWYDWYNIERNKERLESSYNREQYSITLDGNLTSEIKKYNRNELTKGGYFDWKTIENGQSSFIDKYFDKKRDNIVGDNS